MTNPPEITFEEAIAILKSVAQKRPALLEERIPFHKAIGRVASHRILAGMTVPPYTNSAVDGFALNSKWTDSISEANPLSLPIKQVVIAGDTKSQAGNEVAAWQIMTGAPFPEGLDASVKVEEVEVRDQKLILRRPVANKENAREAGEDFHPQSIVLEAGTRLEAKHLMALAALGLVQIQAKSRPKICLLATGKELVSAESQLQPGQIRNATAPYLCAALEALGVEIHFLGTVGDEPKDFFTKMEEALALKPDIMITTGAVSMGIKDHIRPSLLDMGAHIHFHRVSIRPGKPILFAELPQGPAFFGLPGNPVSSVIGLRFFIEPYLKLLSGQAPDMPFQARLAETIRKPKNMKCFFKAKVDFATAIPSVNLLAGQASFMISSLLEANAWAVVGAGVSEVQKGSAIEVWRQ